jgi:protein-S-isoprenylcysteine O-methyltransferase Ste14
MSRATSPHAMASTHVCGENAVSAPGLAVCFPERLKMRFVPLIGLLVLIAIAFGVRPLVQWRRHGTFGIHLFRSGRISQTVRDLLLVLLFGLLVGQAIVVAQSGWGGLDLLVTEDGAVHQTLQALGGMLMLCGIGLLTIAQLDLGAAWRIGIEESAKPGLVTDGLYGYSRNPIYLGLLIAVAGYAALLPTLMSIILLVGSYIGMRAQITAEEDYLLRTYGDAFRDYAARVGRFVPRLGLR